MKTILILIACIHLLACSSLNIKNIDKTSTVLVLAKTSDQFYLQHLDFNLVPRLITRTYEVAKPNWKLSELFVDYVISMSESSTFTFVAFDPPNIDNTSNELISSSNIEILELAKTYGADYILALQTRHVLDENLILQDHTHYGFWHIIKLGLTGFYGEGHPYIHGRIELIDARHTDESWYGKQQIKRYACYDSYFIVPFYDRAEFNLPLEAIDGEVISFSDPQELEHMYQHSKESFMKLFQYALEKCKLVPGTSLTKRYSRKTKD